MFRRAAAVGIGLVAVVLLSACASDGPAKAVATNPNSSSSTSTTKASTSRTPTTTAQWECAPSADDCTSDEVIATVAKLYEAAGATTTEAACLAPVTGEGKHAVNEAFDVPTDAQTKAAVACVGSEARLRVIATALADYFGKNPTG